METDNTLYHILHAQELVLAPIKEKVLETAITTDSADKERHQD